MGKKKPSKQSKNYGVKTIILDPPWHFSSPLQMKDGVKRSADSQYKTLTMEDIKNLPINELCAEDAVIALWVPSSMVQDGLDCIKKYGFKFVQIVNWNKTKIDPFKDLKKSIKKKSDKKNISVEDVIKLIDDFNLVQTLGFGMGNLFRNTNEIALIGVRGSIYKELKNKSQRNVLFDQNFKHSQKPEALQDSLELMFPGLNATQQVELFGRRQRPNWTVLGNQTPSPDGILGEDIRVSLKKIMK